MDAYEALEKLRAMNWRGTLAKMVIWLVILPLFLLGIFRVTCVNYIDNYELGYQFDALEGTTTVLPHTGYIVTLPFVVKVHHVDLRPMQVCISAIQRVLNCKLVQFDKKGLTEFLSWHGRADYDGPETTAGSSQNGKVQAPEETRFQNILKNYAYDGGGKTYSFLTILRELKPDEGDKK